MVSLAGVAIGCAQLPAADKDIVDTARSRFYDLELLGLTSFTCSVSFDQNTIPKALLADEQVTRRKLIAETTFRLEVFTRTPAVLTHSFPNGTSASDQADAKPLVEWMSSLVTGFFMTWRSKGLHGPIPAFDSVIKSAKKDGDGYVVTSVPENAGMVIKLNAGYVPITITSDNGLVERPIYEPTKEGLIYTSNTVSNPNPDRSISNITMAIENEPVDSFLLPSKIEIKVNDNVDVRYRLHDCKVQKGIVIKLKP